MKPWRRWELVTAAAELPLTVDELKSHLRVDIADDDSLITALIQAATNQVESATATALVTQTWDLWLDNWPNGQTINLVRPPIQSVTHVKYYDESDNELTLDAADYRLDAVGFPGRVVLKNAASWPSVTLRANSGINVRFVSGYGLAADVPENLKLAIKLAVGDWYENRENTLIAQGVTVAPMPMAFDHLVSPYRNHQERF